ncbi:MAG TPA: hypothetical protein VG916_10575 [Gemmatimonadaceae bacterium]|nr:hypothetical protein [Gemmatimonadaceae bacterium]
MNPPHRRVISTPGERRDQARSPASVALSVALHVVLVAALLQLTVVRADWMSLLMRVQPPPVERVGFLQLPKGPATTEAPRRGGDNRPVTGRPPAARLIPVAPVEVPSALPPIPRARPESSADGGLGPLVGGGGDTRGVRPSYSDSRLWVPPAPEVTAPLSGTKKLDSAIAPIFRELADSMRAAAAAGRDPTDWTFKIGGQKYGIDQKFIRLGPFSIPTAALALLPLNVQANPMAVERDRRLAQMRTEIMEQAQRASRDEDFQKAVKALRERKEKEREEQKKGDPPGKPPTVTP